MVGGSIFVLEPEMCKCYLVSKKAFKRMPYYRKRWLGMRPRILIPIKGAPAHFSDITSSLHRRGSAWPGLSRTFFLPAVSKVSTTLLLFTYRRTMYKTVRKGDASLQYTILPQTDQFSSLGYPHTSGKLSSKCVKYSMGSLMVLIILACVATPFLMNQNDHNLFASTMLAMGRIGHSAVARNSSRSEDIAAGRSRNRPTGSESMTDATRRNDLEETTLISLNILRAEAPEKIIDVTSEDLSSTLMDTTSVTLEELTSRRTDFVDSTNPSSQIVASSSSKLFSSSEQETTRIPSGLSRKAKMPRVTLKLRENETIPQMYMKAGIASYKKGNITTSVLAHGLSLEGLIFKTPEGTIKPWPQKWFFTDPTSDFQWKGPTQMPMTIYILLAGLAALASISMVLMFYVQRKAAKRQRQCIEEPEVECQEEGEEDKSTLLGVGSVETEEKE
ncbi:uncharacterized protein [Prorops nasuta]|uniref:uncharacterized protein isoform X2 n=1 Tax=Prorops nasuta TaxID=863751 RepID=UPI0034CFB49B